MSLYSKLLFYSASILFLLFAAVFTLTFSSYKDAHVMEAKAQANTAVAEFEQLITAEAFAPADFNPSAEAFFGKELFTSVSIKDFVENTLFKRKDTSALSAPGILSVLTGRIQTDTLTINFKGAGGKNLVATVKLNDSLLQQEVNAYFLSMLLQMAGVFILGIMILAWVFHALLQPLHSLRRQIFHLQEGKLIENKDYPKTKDLRDLVVMLNESVINLKSKFQKDTEMLNRYYDLIYNDEETGLNNRNYFMMHLATELENKTTHDKGVVVFIKIMDFDRLNKAHSFKQVHEAMQDFAALLQNVDTGFTILARIKPDTFAYLFTEHDLGKIKQTVDKLYVQLEEKLRNKFDDGNTDIAVSLSEYEKGESTKNLLSRLDTALNEAMIKTDNKKIAVTGHGHKALSKEERINLIEYAFNSDGFNIELRPIQDLKEDKKSFLKVLVYIVDRHENSYSKREFFSILYEKGLVADYNKKVIDKVCSRYRMINHKITAMVTISSDFISSLDHIRWLGNKLEELEQNPNIKICFTIKDDVAHQEIEKMIQFAKLIYRFKHYIAISGFTLAQEKLTYLQRIKPRFIIADQDYVEKLYFEDKSKVKALQFMISEAGAKTIIAYVDDPKMVSSLHELDVHYLLSTNYKGEY